MPEVFSFVQEIEEPSQKCDLCKKVMKIFADELDKDDVSFQNFNLFYLFHILSSILLLPNVYENQRNIILQNDSNDWVFFFIYLVTNHTWYFLFDSFRPRF